MSDDPDCRTLCLIDEGTFYKDEAGSVLVPKYMKKEGVRGVFLGGCVLTGIGKISGRRRRERAHVHLGGEHDRWICFQLPDSYLDEDCALHMLAHIRARRAYHGEQWQQAMVELGQHIDDQHWPPRSRCSAE